MKGLDSGTIAGLQRIARSYLLETEDLRVDIWTRGLPGFRFAAGNPVVRSLLMSVGTLLLVVLTNLRSLDLDFLYRQATLAFEVFIGFYAGSYFCRTTYRGYRRLASATLLPEDTFRRWFAGEISRFFGSINLLRTQERQGYGLRDVFRKDRPQWIWFLAWMVVIYPVLLLILDVPDFELSLGCLLQYFFLFLWCYSWLWTPHWVIFGIAFLVRLAKLPVRYFYGIPSELTLKKVGDVVVRLNYMAFVHFMGLIVFLHAWRVFPRDPDLVVHMNPWIVLLFFTAFATYIIVSSFLSPLVTQAAIVKTMAFYRSRKRAEFANHMEEAFEGFLREPTEGRYQTLMRHTKHMKLFRRLPVLGLTVPYLLIVLLIFALDIGATWLYLRTSLGSWENLAAIFAGW